MYLTILGSPQLRASPDLRAGEVVHVYAEGATAGQWLAGRGWRAEASDLPLRVVADELVVPEGSIRRVWHSAARLIREPLASDYRAVLLFALDGTLFSLSGQIHPQGSAVIGGRCGFEFSTTSAAAWAEVVVDNARREWIADAGSIEISGGDGDPTATWNTLASMFIALLNSDERFDEPVSALMREAVERAAAALLVERRLFTSGGGGGFLGERTHRLPS
jgi:hypothetical protein